jgi:dimethylargininase
MRVLVRPPDSCYVHCIRSDSSRRIDFDRALRQHAAYRGALRACGASLVELPPEPDLPDACFVEDTTVVRGGVAVITRPGAPARVRETESVARALEGHLRVRRMERGRLDGGDVLLLDATAVVGLSARTDAEGAGELGRLLEMDVRPIPVGRFLHLKSAMTPIGGRRVIRLAGEFTGFEGIETDEPAGANVLVLGQEAIVSAAAPATAERLRSEGLRVHPVDLGEFHAGDAGVTCLSVPLDHG